jgi:hypothetical protein
VLEEAEEELRLPTIMPPKRGACIGVGNGLKAHHYFGRSRNRPKPAGFSEMARAYWTTGGSAVR